MPITAMVGANASLKVKTWWPSAANTWATSEKTPLTGSTSKNVEFIPSESNCFMVNLKRPGREFFAGMARKKVYVGRVLAGWPPGFA